MSKCNPLKQWVTFVTRGKLVKENNIFNTRILYDKLKIHIMVQPHDNLDVKDLSEAEGLEETNVDELIDSLEPRDDDIGLPSSDGDHEQKRKGRSRSFKQEEVKLLLNLIEKYKSIILNKSTVNVVNQSKNAAWNRICKEYNKQGFNRTADCLKTKWENLKKEANKVTTNKYNEGIDEFVSHTATLIAQANGDPNINDRILDSADLEDSKAGTDLLESWEPSDNEMETANNGENHGHKRKSRSRSFKEKEVRLLLALIEKYKSIILNKSTVAIVNQKKDATWKKICKEHNKQGFNRTADCLKTKWENLKREANKVTKNKPYEGIDELVTHTVTLMAQAKEDLGIEENAFDIDAEINDKQDVPNGNDFEDWEYSDVKEADDSDEEIENKRRMNRTSNFSPKECELLLECVRREKNNIFLKSNTAGAIRIKNRAWNRITQAYNKLSPQKRNTKVLRIKFRNMKKLTKSMNYKNYFQETLCSSSVDEQETAKMIKSEPKFEYDIGMNNGAENINEESSFLDDKLGDKHLSFGEDPLSAVLSTDSGLGWINTSEDEETTRLKQELLNYKMETAKLERKRLEEQIKVDAAHREVQQIESALKLRTARLEAIAAALKLPPLHPALMFTTEELPAQEYLNRYNLT